MKFLNGAAFIALIVGASGIMNPEGKIQPVSVAIVTAALIVLLAFAVPHTAEAKQLSEDEVYQIAIEVTEHYNICPEFLQAMAFRESSYRTDVKNGSCIGLMQVSEKWHTDRMARLGVDSLYDPYGNMLVAADYLSELFEEYEDVGVVLMTYNGDSDAEAFSYCEAELSDYADDILTLSAELERAHGK